MAMQIYRMLHFVRDEQVRNNYSLVILVRQNACTKQRCIAVVRL